MQEPSGQKRSPPKRFIIEIAVVIFVGFGAAWYGAVKASQLSMERERWSHLERLETLAWDLWQAAETPSDYSHSTDHGKWLDDYYEARSRLYRSYWAFYQHLGQEQRKVAERVRAEIGEFECSADQAPRRLCQYDFVRLG